MDYGSKGPLADPIILENFQKCMDVDGLYKWAATYGIDVRRYAQLLFWRLCEDEKPLSFLLHAVDDVGLRNPHNFGHLLERLEYALRKDGGRQRGRSRRDIPRLRQWMSLQLHLGLRSEEEILWFAKFVGRLSTTARKEFPLRSLITSFRGLQSSPILGFRELGMDTQCQIVKLIAQGPVTRQLLDIGISFVEAMQQYLQLERSDLKISEFIRSIVFANYSRQEHEKRVQRVQYRSLMRLILEAIWGLPKELRDSVILITTKKLIRGSRSMPAMNAAIKDLPVLWLFTLCQRISRGGPSLKVNIETFFGTGEPERAIPYLRQLDDWKQASFVFRHWFGPRSLSDRIRAQHFLDEFLHVKRKDSPWVSMLQAAQKDAREFVQPLNVPMRQIFKTLQKLDQSVNIVDIVKQYRKLPAIINDLDIVYIIREHLDKQPKVAERMLYFYPGLRLEKCPELAERMILNPDSHPLNALQYMQRHSPHLLVLPEHRSREQFARERKQLLEGMALAYSLAPHIPHPLALRWVHECYTQHVKEGLGPLPVAMARAFTLAGLIRPLKQGHYISTMTIRYILSIIRSTEGADIADRVKIMVYNWREVNSRQF